MRSRKFLTSEKYTDMRESYIRYGKDVGVLFGADASTAETDMREILALDIKLANVSRLGRTSVIKHFSCSTQLNLKFILLINVKIPTMVIYFIYTLFLRG